MIETTKEEKLQIAEIELNKHVVGFEKLDERSKRSLILAFCMGMSYQCVLDTGQQIFEAKNFIKG